MNPFSFDFSSFPLVFLFKNMKEDTFELCSMWSVVKPGIFDINLFL